MEAVPDKETPTLPFGMLTPKQASLLPDGPRDLPPCIIRRSQGPALSKPSPILVLRTLCSQSRNPLDSIQQFDFGPSVELPSLTVHGPY